jgi:hypothetical protein
MARKWTVASVAGTCLAGPRLFALASTRHPHRSKVPSPGPLRLVKAPAAVHPLPRGERAGTSRDSEAAAQGGGAVNESQKAKRKTQSRVYSARERQKKIKRQRANGKG